jgi:glycosyltransferase involved in cell wall biosynthesis
VSAPLVSCILPVYNGEKYIRQAIESVLAQSYPRVEIVVVDDGSTDGTEYVVRTFGDRVRYLRQDNAGPTIARNTGLAAATGELIAFIDADDLWSTDRLAVQYADLIAEPPVEVSVCLILNFFEPGFEPATEYERNHPKNAAVAGHAATGILLWKRTIERIGPFTPELHHGSSADWFLRARSLGVQDRLVNKVLVHRRIHGENLSKKFAEDSRSEFLSVIKASLDKRRKEQGT